MQYVAVEISQRGYSSCMDVHLIYMSAKLQLKASCRNCVHTKVITCGFTCAWQGKPTCHQVFRTKHLLTTGEGPWPGNHFVLRMYAQAVLFSSEIRVQI